MNENEPGGYCRQHGVRRDECGCQPLDQIARLLRAHLGNEEIEGKACRVSCSCGQWTGDWHAAIPGGLSVAIEAAFDSYFAHLGSVFVLFDTWLMIEAGCAI